MCGPWTNSPTQQRAIGVLVSLQKACGCGLYGTVCLDQRSHQQSAISRKFLSIEPVLRIEGRLAVAIEKGLLHLLQMTIPLEVLLDGPVSLLGMPRAFVANGLS
jgi:hypothetical protein